MLADCTAYDLILVQSCNDDDDNTIKAAACSDCMFRFGTKGSEFPYNNDDDDDDDDCGLSVYLLVVDHVTGNALRFPVHKDTIRQPLDGSNKSKSSSKEMTDNKHDAAALIQLASCLKPGSNSARFLLLQKETDEIVGIAPMHIYLWHAHSDQMVVVDVDGTITKSTLTGFWQTAVMRDYSHTSCHSGVCQFLSALQMCIPPPNHHNVVRMVYLTNRPITYADPTRELLLELRQDGHRLPEGPLIGFTGGLAGVFKMDFYHANPHEFKYDTLKKYVARPFQDLGVTNVFYAGFGNTVFDMHAYHNAGMDLHRMFIIDKQSRIYCLDRKEHKEEDADDSKDVQRALDHPKEYAMARGTLFADGYHDAKLLSLVLSYKKV